MRDVRLGEITAFYRAYQQSKTSKEYLKKMLSDVIENYLILYVINYAAAGNTSSNITPIYEDYYKYGLKLRKINEYNMQPSEIWKLKDEIIVPF